MKTATQRRLINAIAAACAGKGKKDWVVHSSYTDPAKLVKSSPMTYREAKAHARIVIQACGWADVQRA